MNEQTRKALLIGNASFPAEDKLLDLKCPLNDVEGLQAVLSDPAIGGFDTVDILCDRDSNEVKRKLITFLADARSNETILIYYSGHGKLDGSYQLNFCTRDSEVDVLEATAVPVAFVRDQLSRCHAQNTVLMLDCCYSGAAKGILSRGDVDDQLKLSVKDSGTYLLTASNATETAQEKEGDRFGVFTKHLIEALETGNADKDGNGVTTMDDLYHYIVSAVRSDSPQKPTRQVDGHGRIIVARSGKNSRLDTAAKLSSELFTQVANGYLDASIATAAVDVARKSPSTLTASETTFDAAITAHLAKRIPLGEFVTAYWNFQLENGSEPKPTPKPKPRPEPEPVSKPKPEPIPKPSPEPQSDFGKFMSLLFGKRWKGSAAHQPIVGSRAAEDKTHSALFQWIIPLGIFIAIAAIGETAIDPDTLIGYGFLGITVMGVYLIKCRTRLNTIGWIISILALLSGVGMMMEGISYSGY